MVKPVHGARIENISPSNCPASSIGGKSQSYRTLNDILAMCMKQCLILISCSEGCVKFAQIRQLVSSFRQEAS